MPMIYIPQEANLRDTYKPHNQIEGICQLLESKLTLKVQNNLAKFKHDINTLRKKIAFLALEQEKLEKTPVQQTLDSLHIGI